MQFIFEALVFFTLLTVFMLAVRRIFDNESNKKKDKNDET